MRSNACQIVGEFLHAFMSGDIRTASALAREDFSFRAPLLAGRGDKAAYFAGASDKARFIHRFHILRQWGDDSEVSTLYELEIRTPDGGATLPVSEWHTVEADQITSTFMVFDTAAAAVQLLRRALGGHH